MAALPKDFQKKEKIITAAFTVFARDGLTKGTIADIAREAGIGKGTVYEYFSSKDEIFLALIEHFFDQMLSGYTAVFKSDLPPSEKLESLIAATFYSMDALINSGDSSYVMILLETFLYAFRKIAENPQNHAFADFFQKFYAMLQPIFDEGIANGDFRPVNPEEVSFLFFASLDGIALHYFMQHHRYDMEQVIALAKSIFLNGIKKPKPEEI